MEPSALQGLDVHTHTVPCTHPILLLTTHTHHLVLAQQSDFSDGHDYRGLRGAAWSRAGGWRRGWSYNEYVTPENRAVQADVSKR